MRRAERPLRDIAERYGLRWRAGEPHESIGKRLLDRITESSHEMLDEVEKHAEVELEAICKQHEADSAAVVDAVEQGQRRVAARRAVLH